MYLAYNESFRFLKSHEVAVFTLTTPIFVTLLADAFDRTLRGPALGAAVLAVLGFGGAAGTFVGIAKLLFGIAIALFLIFLVLGLLAGKGIKDAID